MKKGVKIVLVLVSCFFLNIFLVHAAEFNGTILKEDGTPLNNAIINVTVRNMQDWSIVGYNTTTSNGSGWFNVTIVENQNWMYQPTITHKNGNYIDYVGKALPAFPYFEFAQLSPITFYLTSAGTINITAINSTGQRVSFTYQIKDTRLSFPVAEGWSTSVTEASIALPRDRNYSIIIYPDQSVPLSFDWNNFTASSSYNFGNATTTGILSKYNFSTKTLYKQFNTTMEMTRVTGYVNRTGISSWEQYNIVSYLLEPGNMIFPSQGAFPFNMSAFNGQGDTFNQATGFYNISVPAAAETVKVLFYATAKNGSFYGGFANFTAKIRQTIPETNISLYGLLGTESNISLNNAANWNQINITTAQQQFNLVNATNSTLSQISFTVESTVDYSNYGALEFTYVSFNDQTGVSNFKIPLINETGVKEINLYSSNYAPRRVTFSLAQILANNNISLKTFNPGDIDGDVLAANINMALYISNSTCDVPNPPSPCMSGGSQNMDEFKPLAAIIGGGKLSFRMGTGNITVHYVNVDMLASGPPDALFDDSTTDQGDSSSFAQAVRFGSGGPTIYDFILVSMPYTETAGTGLNDSQDINISLPIFYDDNFNVIWNTSANGTNASWLAANNSHYSAHQAEWQTLMEQNVCSWNVTYFNVTYPCFVNRTENIIWVRLPHFSGAGPSVAGATLAAAPSTPASSSSSSSGGGGGGGAASSSAIISAPQNYTLSSTQLNQGTTQDLNANDKVSFSVDGTSYEVTLVSFSRREATVNISGVNEEHTLALGEVLKLDLDGDGNYDLGVRFLSSASQASLTFASLSGTVPAEAAESETVEEAESVVENEVTGMAVGDLEGGSGRGKKILIGVIILLFIVGIGFMYHNSSLKKQEKKKFPHSRK